MLKYVCFIYYFIWLLKIGSPAWRVNNDHMYHVIMRGWVEWQNTQTKTLLGVRYDTCYCLHLQLTNTTQAPHKHHTSTLRCSSHYPSADYYAHDIHFFLLRQWRSYFKVWERGKFDFDQYFAFMTNFLKER